MAYTEVAVVESSSTAGTRYDGQGTAGENGGAGNGLSFQNNGKTILLLENTGSSAPVVTVVTGQTVDSLAIANVAITMVANQDQFIGPFPRGVWNQTGAGAGLVYIEFDSNASDVLVLPISY